MKRIAMLVIAAGFLSACAASGSVETISAAKPAIDSSRSGAVEVTSSTPGGDGAVVALRSAIVGHLVNKKVFQSISDSSATDYVLKARITDVSTVSQAARILLGAFAGQARIAVNVQLYDGKGKLLSDMIAKGESSGGHIFAGTTEEAIDQAAVNIADYLLQHRKL